MYGDEKKEEFVTLRAGNMSYAKIAETLGIDRKTALRWGLELNPDVEEARRMLRDSLREKLRWSMESRAERIHSIWEKLGQRLENEDFSGLSAEKAAQLFFMVEAKLAGMLSPLNCEPISSLEKELSRG
ncbi:MAG: hypothetical protein Q4D98_09985 [Planctomycetia bacterium]|nr:hypothetical protein [Planctomycetia bacterium]